MQYLLEETKDDCDAVLGRQSPEGRELRRRGAIFRVLFKVAALGIASCKGLGEEHELTVCVGCARMNGVRARLCVCVCVCVCVWGGGWLWMRGWVGRGDL
jgi:hypothetical protein